MTKKTHEDDMDWMLKNPMLYMVLIPSCIAIIPPTLAVAVIWYLQS
tara:strand:+ start:470 stop:607 length:138 start_codon:yes stop_codon:yes gene_type:complete